MHDLAVIADGMRALSADGLIGAERVMLEHEQVECPVIHHFGPGIYIRELSMKAGTMAIGHRQKQEHVNVMLKGKVLMLMDDGSTKEVSAPLMYIGKPGRKIGYVIEDMVWQNIYATAETSIEALEAMFLDKSPAFHDANIARFRIAFDAMSRDRDDFQALLSEYGFTEDVVRQQSENEADQIGYPPGTWKVKTGASPIQGVGIFATSDFAEGERIAPARIAGMRTPAGRFTNHSSRPNARMVLLANGDIDLVASGCIKGCAGGFDGQEITIDYRQALALSGVYPKEKRV